MLKQIVAVVLCGALISTGCASAAGPRIAQAPQPPIQDNSAIAEYVQRLAPGTKVRVEQSDGTSFRGTLMKATPQAIVVQKHTRVPEAPVEVPLNQVSRVTINSSNGSSAGKTVAIGVGVGVAAFFGILGVLAAIYSD
jgi:hypothetical protein